MIGEALSRLKAIAPGLLARISDSDRIIGMRNIIAHGYDVIDADIIWTALKDHLPVLKVQISELDPGE